ncbi:MAG: hypothetical protein KZQ89_15620 [Candidatus Thiodiazotropha sp. (ex Lucinoma kastoroae)]|nr:hypothetical protein [Candidatus Thiodiazotropha sp. (ex Lucinoma kastoroae)]MCU7861834.1 hypothetical protein [Candidatus Thiodiazotropha sp. (ex Lucinoma kastoroae)]
MREDLCTALDKLEKLCDLAISGNEAGSIEKIDTVWWAIIKAIQEHDHLSETETHIMLELDRILKWELLDYEKPTFKWSAVSWSEIKEVGVRCASAICQSNST